MCLCALHFVLWSAVIVDRVQTRVWRGNVLFRRPVPWTRARFHHHWRDPSRTCGPRRNGRAAGDRACVDAPFVVLRWRRRRRRPRSCARDGRRLANTAVANPRWPWAAWRGKAAQPVPIQPRPNAGVLQPGVAAPGQSTSPAAFGFVEEDVHANGAHPVFCRRKGVKPPPPPSPLVASGHREPVPVAVTAAQTPTHVPPVGRSVDSPIAIPLPRPLQLANLELPINSQVNYQAKRQASTSGQRNASWSTDRPPASGGAREEDDVSFGRRSWVDSRSARTSASYGDLRDSARRESQSRYVALWARLPTHLSGREGVLRLAWHVADSSGSLWCSSFHRATLSVTVDLQRLTPPPPLFHDCCLLFVVPRCCNANQREQYCCRRQRTASVAD